VEIERAGCRKLWVWVNGLPPEAANETYENWVNRIHPEDRERKVQHLFEVLKSESEDYSTEYRIIRPNDGAVRWIRVVAKIDRAPDGRALRLVGADLDVTDQMLAQATLRESEERFRLIANSAPVPIWVTKLDRIKFDTKEAQQAATVRKMLVSMAKDLRVLIIKLADRLHNMRTLRFLPEARKVEISRETMDIYAPIANRLGMGLVKGELEDLAFLYLEPQEYARIQREVEKSLVLEVAFDSIHLSKRHKSGLAMRFPRISRIRDDKPAHEADQIATLLALVT